MGSLVGPVYSTRSDLDAMVEFQRKRILETPVAKPVAPMSGRGDRAPIVNMVVRYPTRYADKDFTGS